MIKEMQTLKRKCLRAFVRFKQSAFARKGTLALVALTLAAGNAMAESKGAAGFTKATQEVSSYQTPVSNLMKAIAAVIVGGTSMSGGRGSVVGTVFGTLIVAVMNNLLNLIGVDPYLSTAFKGAIIIAAVLLQRKEKN